MHQSTGTFQPYQLATPNHIKPRPRRAKYRSHDTTASFHFPDPRSHVPDPGVARKHKYIPPVRRFAERMHSPASSADTSTVPIISSFWLLVRRPLRTDQAAELLIVQVLRRRTAFFREQTATSTAKGMQPSRITPPSTTLGIPFVSVSRR